MKTLLHFEIATALRSSLKGYNIATFKSDASAGLVVSLIALPLAMALSIAVGLPPQNGIYTAIVAGIIAALLGGSTTQVSGPTAAFVVIIAPIVTEHGLSGLIWCQILAGFLLLIMGFARLGRFIRFVPYPVVTGFTTGIGIVIATLALNDFFGLGIPKFNGNYIHKLQLLYQYIFEYTGEVNLFNLAIGIVTLLVILLLPKLNARIPSPIVGIFVGIIMAFYINHNEDSFREMTVTNHTSSIIDGLRTDLITESARFNYKIRVDTIATRFHYNYTVEVPAGESKWGGTLTNSLNGKGTIIESHFEDGIPPYPPTFHLPELPTLAQFKLYLVPALVIAVLAALESLLSATVADHMAGTTHNPNAELNGIGIANIAAALASGIPATGAIARTAANIHSGAKTPIACVIHSLLILLYVLFFSIPLDLIPMASLAALLLVVAYRMSHIGQCIHIFKTAPFGDSIVLLVTFMLTVFVDMVAGVSAGMALAFIFYLKRKTHVSV